MALIQCKECKREISDQAFACPHCGSPIQRNEHQLERFERNGNVYDISSVIRYLNWRDLKSASMEIFRIFEDEISSNILGNTDQEIEYKIWNQYIMFQEQRYPNTEQPNIPLYQCNGHACEIYRVIWWLERNDTLRAKQEIYFGFPFGATLNGQQEREMIERILQDIEKIYETIISESNQIIYPDWFLEWKHQTSVRNEIRTADKIATASCTVRCRNCGSTNIQKVGIAGRVVGGLIFGGLSVEGKAQFYCKDCRYQW